MTTSSSTTDSLTSSVATRAGRASAVTVASLLSLTLVGGTAAAHWSTEAAGFGLAETGDIGVPTLSVTPLGNDAALMSFIAGSGAAPSSYVATATGADGGTCTVTLPATSCTIGLAEDTTYSFTGVAKVGGWTSGASAVETLTTGVTPTGLTASPSNIEIGTGVSQVVELTATKDGEPDLDFSGPVDLEWTGAYDRTGSTLPPTAEFDNGVAQVNITLVEEAAGTLIVAARGRSATLNVTASAATPVDADPAVRGIDRASSAAESTLARSVSWTVTFSEPVTGVNTADFALDGTGKAGASLTSVVSSSLYSDSWTVTATTGANGTLRLDLHDDDSIVDQTIPTANKLGGSGLRNGSFTTGQSYTINRLPVTAVPSRPNLMTASDSGASDNDDQTSVPRPRFDGTAPAGTLVRLYRDGSQIGSLQLAAGSTAWQITPTADVAQGVGVPVTATAQAAGQTESSASPALPVTFDRSAPTATVSRVQAATNKLTAVEWTVTFSEAVTGVNAGDFTVTRAGLTGNSSPEVVGSGAVYTVSASTGNGTGTIKLGFNQSQSRDAMIKDAVSLAFVTQGYDPGAAGIYTIDRTAPTAAAVITTRGAGLVAGRLDSGDVIKLRYSEDMLASSLITGWDGTASRAITLTLDDEGGVDEDDAITFGDLNVGRLDLADDDYATGDSTASATVTLSGAELTIALTSTPSTAAPAGGGGMNKKSTFIWMPNSAATDIVGNRVSSDSRGTENNAGQF
jgi:hypothetical protein